MRTKTGNKSWTVGLTLAVALALVATLALAREKYEEKFEKTEALARDGVVRLSNISGDIEITSWNQSQVRIEAVKVSEASSLDKAKANAGEVTIEVTRDGDALRIETKYPERRGFWRQESTNVSVNYKLRVPDKASVEVRSISGDVTLASIGGSAKVHTISGDVDINGSSGVDVNLTSGDLTVENIAGDAYLKTISGDITASKIAGSLELSSVSGDIDLKEVSEARTVTGKTISGNITYVGTILAGGNYELKSHSGNIEMSIPANAGFDFEANTFSGVIDTDFPIEVSGKISPKQIHGTVNKGGARIRVATFSGNVDLKKR
jgi:DUF4097 and DUF4098 domain-containing protein YvlB